MLSGAWDQAKVALSGYAALAALDAEWLLGERAEHLETAARSVRTSSGRLLAADAIVLATGIVPRSPQGHETGPNVHVLRTVEHALHLSQRLKPGRKLVVVGNGVLGSEVAATAAGMGVDVSLVGRAARPMANQLGDVGSSLLATLHEAAGVRLLGEVESVSLNYGCEAVSAVALSSGEVLPADDVLFSIGSKTATDWLVNSGLALDDGIACDSYCSAAPGIWAVGDVARWDHPTVGRLRLENRTNAGEQAVAVAADILGNGRPYAPILYFWTDQYGHRVQVLGHIPSNAHLRITDGDVASAHFVGVAFTADQERPVGVLGWGMPKQTRIRRLELQTAMAPIVS